MDFPGIDPSERAERPSRNLGGIVVLAAFLWFFASVVLLCLGIATALTFWEPPPPAEQAAADRYMRAFAVVVTAGPLAIAVLAGCLRLTKTAVTFAVIGCAVGCLLGSEDGVRELFAPARVPEDPDPITLCIEHSGGDNRCPGG